MSDERWWAACFALCCVLLVLPLWVTEWLPLVDLPQHAAQLSIAERWSDPAFDYPRYFELNWIANSVLPYALAYVLTLVLPIAIALKVTLCIALLGIPLATWRLIVATGGNRWWVFAAFPVAYGYAFAWGFLSFVLAAPLGLLLILAGIRYCAAPSLKTALWLVVLCHALFLSHVLVLAYAGFATLWVVWLGSSSMRDRMRGAAALAAVVPLAVAWFAATKLLTPGTTPTSVPTVLDYGIARFTALLTFVQGAEDTTLETIATSLVILALPFVVGARSTHERWRLAPLGSALLFHFLVPLHVLDTGFVYPRFTLFVVPTLLIALDPAPHHRRAAGPVAVACVVIFLAVVAHRYRAFHRESQGVIALLDQAEPNKRLLALIDNPRSAAVPFFPYLHAGCWYQVRHGGIADFSFAEFYPNRFRYRQGMDPRLPSGVEWIPQGFKWDKHGGDAYDYFLIRRGPQASWSPFKAATTTIELVGSDGPWHLYKQTPRAP